MAAVSHTVSSLLNGVSQQPAIARLASQLEAQEDCYSSLVAGLSRRPPLEHLAKLALASSVSAYNNAIVHSVNRDNIERYTIVISNGNIEVFDTLTGVSKTVNKPQGTAYLNTADPQTNLRVLTVEDYTFIVNRTVTVEMLTAPGDLAANGTLNKSVNKLSDLPADGTGYPAYPSAYVRVGNNPDILTGSGAVYYVAYFPGTYATPYGQTPTNTGPGFWAEVAATGSQQYFNPATMPHALTSNGDGTFTFAEIDWGARSSGDDVNQPVPSFVGRQISDVFFARRRLGFVAGTSVALSAGGGNFFNFWREKQSALTATDPIDIVEHDDAAMQGFHAGMSFNKEIVLWSTQGQWVLSSDSSYLGPNTIDIRRVSVYANSNACRPIVVGDSLFFTVDQDNWAQLQELVLAVDLKVATAPSISDHIPEYIPAGVTKIVAASKTQTLVARTAGDLDALYVWSHLEQQSSRQQSAWSRWNMPAGATVLDISADQWLIVVALRFDDGIYLHKINLAPYLAGSGNDYYLVHLDRKVGAGKVTENFSAGVTTFTLPYAAPTGSTPYLVPRVTDPTQPIPSPIALSPTANADQWTALGDYTAVNYSVGFLYNSWFELSEQFAPRANNAASTDKTLTDEGRLSLQALIWTVDKTSALTGGVWQKQDESSFGIEGRITIDGVPVDETLSSPAIPTTPLYVATSGKLDATHRRTGRFRQPVHMKAQRAIIRLGSLEHRPFAVLTAKWLGDFNYSRAQI